MSLIYESPPPLLAEHGIEFFLVEASGGIMVTNHIHPAIEFLYIEKGCFDITVERKQTTAHEGDLVLFPSNSIHMIEKSDGERGLYYVLKLSPSFLFQMFNKAGIPYILPFFKSYENELPCCFPHARQPAEIKRQWQEMIREYQTSAPSFFPMQRLLACAFLLTFSRVFLPADAAPHTFGGLDETGVRLISESVQFINENYAKPLRATDCAEYIHLSYSYYAKLFRAVVGKSFKEYLTDFRMAKAYNMLLSSTARISEVARACGYDHFSNFIVAFKKTYSCTPGDLRRAMQNTTLQNS